MFYLRITYFQILRYFAYPMEILGTVLKRGIEVSFVVLFWIIVARGSNGIIHPNEIVSYILISSSVAGIASSSNLYFGGMINDVVKTGTINNYLIKPVSLIPYLYATFFGQRATTVAVGVVTFIIGVSLSPVRLTLVTGGLFLAYFVLAFLIITAMSVLIGLAAFYITEASSLRYSLGHVIRVLSGAIIPLSLFPQPWQGIILKSPFPVTLYGPAHVFAPSLATVSNLQLLTTGLIWAVVLWLIAGVLWKRALRNYDAIGI